MGINPACTLGPLVSVLWRTQNTLRTRSTWELKAAEELGQPGVVAPPSVQVKRPLGGQGLGF
jgi:hypothetical protein